MANHAHITPTSLLPSAGFSPPLVGSRPSKAPRIIAAGGPVSRALRTMLDADPEYARVRQLRRAIAERIEADIALLDALAGDPDDEPYLAACDDAALSQMGRFGSQEAWATGDRNDLEEQNEDGGDIVDEPHDAEEDKGAEEDEGYPGAVAFTGHHYYLPRYRLGDRWGQW